MVVRVGEVFDLGSATLERDDMVGFAQRYDPQFFHVDEVAAVGSVFGGLVASGLQTLSLVHSLAVRSGLLERIGGQAGLGIDQIRLPRPVRPGDSLHATMEALSLRPSKGRPGAGIACFRARAANQAGEEVISYEITMLVRLECWELGVPTDVARP